MLTNRLHARSERKIMLTQTAVIQHAQIASGVQIRRRAEKEKHIHRAQHYYERDAPHRRRTRQPNHPGRRDQKQRGEVHINQTGVVWLTRSAAMWRVAFVIMLCAVNVFLFFGTPPDLYTGRDLRVLNYSSLREHDLSLTARVQAIRQHFNPQTTLILSNDWRFAEYYLPEYRVLFFSGDRAKPLIAAFGKQEVYTRPANLAWNLQNIRTIVLFDAQAVAFYKGSAPAQCLTIADRTCLTFYAVPDALALTIRADGLAEKLP